MHSFYLENVTTSVLYKMLEELRAGGNTVKAHPVQGGVQVWSVEGSGILAWVHYYDSTGSRTQVTIQDKPFLVPYSLIEQKVREALRVASAS